MFEDINKPNHIALIMDGNGRYATKFKKPRSYGHKIGMRNLRDIVRFSNKINLKYLTIFAFSTENWNRPKGEVNYLLRILNIAINKINQNKIIEENIRIRWIGFEDKLPLKLLKNIKDLEEKTKLCSGLTLTIAFNYGGQQDLLAAINKIKQENFDIIINKENINNYLISGFLPPVDLLVRTSGEQRISNFLLWQLDYAEIIFNDCLFPEYNIEKFSNDIKIFSNRNRRFGKI